LFEPGVEDYLERYPTGPIVGVIDDPGLARTGKKIPGASWQRDPLSPPFHVNLRWGRGLFRGACCFRCTVRETMRARLPIRFEEAAVVRQPGKRASEEEKQRYREQKKKHHLSTRAVALLGQQRPQLDEKGASRRR